MCALFEVAVFKHISNLTSFKFKHTEGNALPNSQSCLQELQLCLTLLPAKVMTVCCGREQTSTTLV